MTHRNGDIGEISEISAEAATEARQPCYRRYSATSDKRVDRVYTVKTTNSEVKKGLDLGESGPSMYEVTITAPSALLNNVVGAMCSQWQEEDTNHRAFVNRFCTDIVSKPDCKRAVSTSKADLETISSLQEKLEKHANSMMDAKAELKAEKAKSTTLTKAIADSAKGHTSILTQVRAEVKAEKAKYSELKKGLDESMGKIASELKVEKAKSDTVKKTREVKIHELKKDLTAERTKQSKLNLDTDKPLISNAPPKPEGIPSADTAQLSCNNTENYGFIHADSDKFTKGAWSRCILDTAHIYIVNHVTHEIHEPVPRFILLMICSKILELPFFTHDFIRDISIIYYPESNPIPLLNLIHSLLNPHPNPYVI